MLKAKRQKISALVAAAGAAIYLSCAPPAGAAEDAPPNISVGVPPVSPANASAPCLTPAREKILEPYNIELIVDVSGSMSDVDGTGGLSKFEWCHRQVRDLVKRLAPYNKTVTLTTFNNLFSTRENCGLSDVEQVYANTMPAGLTDLVDPLNASFARIKAAFESNPNAEKRALIVVITDGLPNIPRDTGEVNRAIVAFTQSMGANDQVLITFLQVGDTFDGQSFHKTLDNHLVTEGAAFDIVNTQTFAQLKAKGITEALIDSIEHANSSAKKP
ncbi:MAG: VWA domain-containing protein [Cyanobacteria bacterium SZAS TMP-1]|nr:VWA domain-containing protein [Cyanobacteria bacterium SZAS TMP-1]